MLASGRTYAHLGSGAQVQRIPVLACEYTLTMAKSGQAKIKVGLQGELATQRCCPDQFAKQRE